MKTFITLFATVAIFMSCNDNTATGKKEEAPDTTKVAYAYTIDHPDYWETGSKANTQMVLASLKAFEEGDIKKTVKDFADTVMLQFDNFEARVSNDSLAAFLTQQRNTMKSVKIVMDDFESVKSTDGKREYVSLWYKQIWQDQKGVTDSIECMDDLEIKKGKISFLNEKIRHYAKK